MNDDPDNVNLLTPGHFLILEPLVTAPDHNFEAHNVNSFRRWQNTQCTLEEFWLCWSNEYLVNFLKRNRWNTQNCEGDVVVVKEDGLPPCRWFYGRVLAEHPGKDNITWVVTLKTKDSELKRPVSKLCVLPVT